MKKIIIISAQKSKKNGLYQFNTTDEIRELHLIIADYWKNNPWNNRKHEGEISRLVSAQKNKPFKVCEGKYCVWMDKVSANAEQFQRKLARFILRQVKKEAEIKRQELACLDKQIETLSIQCDTKKYAVLTRFFDNGRISVGKIEEVPLDTKRYSKNLEQYDEYYEVFDTRKEAEEHIIESKNC